MAKQIEMVAGGYKVIENEEFISAARLIPFGIFIDFCTRKFHKKHSDLLRKDKNLSIEEIAKKYADKMKAPFFEIEEDYTHTHTLNMQLYVENKCIN